MNLEKDEKVFLDKILELKFNETYKPIFLDVMKDIYMYGSAFSLERWISLNIFSIDDIVNFALQVRFPNLICSIAKSIYSWEIEEIDKKRVVDKLSTAIIETNDPLWIWQFLSAITVESQKLTNDKETLEKLIDAIIKTQDLMRMDFCLRIIVHVDQDLSKRLKDEILNSLAELDELSDRDCKIKDDVEYIGHNLSKNINKKLIKQRFNS